MKFTVAMLCFITLLCSQQKYRVVKPIGSFKKTVVVTKKKKKAYYKLLKHKERTFRLKGPGIFKLQTVAALTKKIYSKGYTISYTINNGIPILLKHTTLKPSNVSEFLKKSSKVSRRKTFDIPLSRGENTIKVMLAESDIPVYGRFIYLAKKNKRTDWVSFKPQGKLNEAEVIVKETATTYLDVKEGFPLKVDVIGPIKLRVLSRLKLTHEDKGQQQYRMEVREDGDIKYTFQLVSKSSKLAHLGSDSEYRITKAKEILIDVPQGKHTYEIRPLTKLTTFIRLLLPKNDVLKSNL